MARVVKQLPSNIDFGGNHNPGYDYESWFDGQIWELTQGVDFFVIPVNFRKAAQSYAKRHGIPTQVRCFKNKVWIKAERND